MNEELDNATEGRRIAEGQRVNYTDTATYGTLMVWATAMGHAGAVSWLRQNLTGEGAGDQKRTGPTEGGVNESAAAAGPLREREDEPRMAIRSGQGKRATKSRARR